MLALHHHPERMLVPELAELPAHLHIDLLPRWQGRGYGRRLIGCFLAGLRAAGVSRVHLGMLATNVGARGFYDRLGFVDLAVANAGPGVYLGRTTEASAPTRSPAAESSPGAPEAASW